jgi:hypothetical protein
MRDRAPSRPDNEDNGGVRVDDEEIGRRLVRCALGDDCPFEPALARLQKEQHERIQSESALAVSIDEVSKKAQKLFEQFDEYCRKLEDYRHDLQAHIDRHRKFDVAIIAIGATVGGFAARWFIGK